MVRATCKNCGDVELRAPAVTVTTCVDTDESTFTFQCPQCHGWHTPQPVTNPDVVRQLNNAGAHMIRWHLPTRETAPAGLGPLTHDELIDFHAAVDAWDGHVPVELTNPPLEPLNPPPVDPGATPWWKRGDTDS